MGQREIDTSEFCDEKVKVQGHAGIECALNVEMYKTRKMSSFIIITLLY